MNTKNYWWQPLAGFIILTPFTPYLDLWLSGVFYQWGEGTVEHFVIHPSFEFLYNWGPFPSVIVGFFSALVACLSYLISYLKKWRRDALYLVFVLILGPVFIVNTVLKDHWGRPRPKQIIEFGGIEDYRPWFYPNFYKEVVPSKSFPCGHCATGFYFLALAILGRRHNNRFLYYFGITFGTFFGFLIGLARIAQGGHFLSDVLASGVLMWLIVIGVDKYVMPLFTQGLRDPDQSQ